MQLQLFQEDEEHKTEKEIKLIKDQVNNLRRGIFGRYDKILIEIMNLKTDIQNINDILGHTAGTIVHFPDLFEEEKKQLQNE